MKKKVLYATSLLTVAALSLSIGVYAATDIKLFINGKAVNADLQIINDSSYVPLRVVSESLGADVKWDGDKRTITITGKVEPLPTDGTYTAGGLVFYDVKPTKGELGWEVPVEARNNGAKLVKGAIFTAVFYGDNGKRIGTAQGSVSDLEVSATKTVTLMTNDDLTGYKTIKFQIDTSY